MILRRRFRLDFYKGRVSPRTHEGHTTVRAMDTPHAREFGKMRRPGLIVIVTPKETTNGNGVLYHL